MPNEEDISLYHNLSIQQDPDSQIEPFQPAVNTESIIPYQSINRSYRVSTLKPEVE